MGAAEAVPGIFPTSVATASCYEGSDQTDQTSLDFWFEHVLRRFEVSDHPDILVIFAETVPGVIKNSGNGKSMKIPWKSPKKMAGVNDFEWDNYL